MAVRHNAESWARLAAYARFNLLRRHPKIQSEIARELVVSQTTVSRVWWGKVTSERVLAAILERVNREAK